MLQNLNASQLVFNCSFLGWFVLLFSYDLCMLVLLFSGLGYVDFI